MKFACNLESVHTANPYPLRQDRHIHVVVTFPTRHPPLKERVIQSI